MFSFVVIKSKFFWFRIQIMFNILPDGRSLRLFENAVFCQIHSRAFFADFRLRRRASHRQRLRIFSLKKVGKQNITKKKRNCILYLLKMISITFRNRSFDRGDIGFPSISNCVNDGFRKSDWFLFLRLVVGFEFNIPMLSSE